MKIPRPFSAGLALLTAALYDPVSDDSVDVARSALDLAADARLAVTSYLGLTITVTEHADGAAGRVLLRLTLLEELVETAAIESSLRLPGSPDDADTDQAAIQLVLYAATPGAFVDLAADISFLTGRDFDPADLDQHQGLAGESDITDVLPAQAVVGEAIGALLAGGRTHQQAYAELDALAAAAHTDRITQATGLLAAITANS